MTESNKGPVMSGIEIETIGGNCPVQAEGAIDGKPFYFRARGEHWTIGIGGEDVIMSPEWSLRQRFCTTRYYAGWMTEDQARKLICKAARLYRRSNRKSP